MLPAAVMFVAEHYALARRRLRQCCRLQPSSAVDPRVARAARCLAASARTRRVSAGLRLLLAHGAGRSVLLASDTLGTATGVGGGCLVVMQFSAAESNPAGRLRTRCSLRQQQSRHHALAHDRCNMRLPLTMLHGPFWHAMHAGVAEPMMRQWRLARICQWGAIAITATLARGRSCNLLHPVLLCPCGPSPSKDGNCTRAEINTPVHSPRRRASRPRHT